ncbi:phosphotransferase [Luteimicrobium subarcticum]|uniref:Phosphotransferase family enzyme n=1 Tax=Luteimicrobium subarcticum TaxID=620910 RepID=A0A2M8W1C9_9MICO|nr:phosphotransferase [Luteimicrobium subarcticum]PJI84737.1 phosphotransferase family enzyme [Luteimicrobium subarcticum]
MPHDVQLLLVPAPSGEAVLVRRPGTDGRAGLPVVTTDGGAEVPDVLRPVAELLGDVRYLRSAGRAEGDDGDRYVLRVLDALPGDPPAGHVWLPARDVDPAALAVPEGLRGAVGRWLAELGGAPVPAERAPWARPGGIVPFLAWVDAQVRASGAVPTGAPEVVQQWSISLVLRVPTDRGALFAKAVTPYFGAEPALTTLLAARTPDHLPSPLAADPQRGWLLLADAGIGPVDAKVRAANTAGLRALAAVQRAWAGRTDEVVAAGAAVRGPSTLAHDVADVLDVVGAAGRLVPSRALGAGALDRLRVVAPTVEDAAAAITATGIPETVVHGDLHPANAGLRPDGTACLLDWSDAAVGHPFVDADLWLSHVEPDELAAARSTFAEAWDLADAVDVDALFGHALVLGAAYQLVTSAWLLRAVEQDERVLFAGGVLFWSKRLLEVTGG